MNAFPAFFPLAGRMVVIAGSGEAAEVKARLFDDSPATLVRLEGEAALDPAGYVGASLAFVAGGDIAFLTGAREAAGAAGVPANVVDHPELCDFTAPAVIDRGEVVAAVGTAGASPLLAALLRNDIEARLPEGVGRLAGFLRAVQDEVRLALPDLAARRGFLSALLIGPIADAAMAGEADRARAMLRVALAGQPTSARQGRVCVISSGAAADLLSLRAARRLAQADVLVLGPGAEAGVVALARRDARRMTSADADLAALAGEGLLVVITPPDGASLQGLRDAGIVVEILASAPDSV